MSIKNRKTKSSKQNESRKSKKIMKKDHKIKNLDLDFEAFKEALSIDNYVIRTESMSALRHA